MFRSTRLAVAAFTIVLLAACSDANDGADSTQPSTVTITVGAAASLTASFEKIGAAFSEANPGITVQFSFGASSDIARQIGEGAPIDVFASADSKNMDAVAAGAGIDGDPAVFATNSLQVIVGPGNPKGVRTLADLAREDVLVVACSPEVPIGRYTQQVLDAAGVVVTPVSLEENVKAIVAKVTLGEADAGVVYRTDVIAAGSKAEGVDIPADVNVTASYPIAVLKASAARAAAVDFVEFVLGEEGRAILRDAGFGGP